MVMWKKTRPEKESGNRSESSVIVTMYMKISLITFSCSGDWRKVKDDDRISGTVLVLTTAGGDFFRFDWSRMAMWDIEESDLNLPSLPKRGIIKIPLSGTMEEAPMDVKCIG